MKRSEIEIGKSYVAKVSGKLTVVRVNAIREVVAHSQLTVTYRYDVTNLKTKRQTTFRSAAKFRRAFAETPLREVVQRCLAAGSPDIVEKLA
jgi:hypothetical protein